MGIYWRICNVRISVAYLGHCHRSMTPQTQEVNWTCIRHTEDVLNIFWTSYVRSIYVLCLRRIKSFAKMIITSKFYHTDVWHDPRYTCGFASCKHWKVSKQWQLCLTLSFSIFNLNQKGILGSKGLRLSYPNQKKIFPVSNFNLWEKNGELLICWNIFHSQITTQKNMKVPIHIILNQIYI